MAPDGTPAPAGSGNLDLTQERDLMGFPRAWLRLRNPPILLLSLPLPGPGEMGTWQGQSERRWTVILSKLSRGQAQCEVPTHARSHPTAVVAKQGAGAVSLREIKARARPGVLLHTCDRVREASTRTTVPATTAKKTLCV